jgi:hypothetical protein
MTPQEREQEVRFVEPYDKQRAGYCVDLVFAEHSVTADCEAGTPDGAATVFVEKGSPYLC